MRKLEEVTLAELEETLATLPKKTVAVFLQDGYQSYSKNDIPVLNPSYTRKDLKQEIDKRKKLELVDVSSVPVQILEQFLNPASLRYRFYEGYDHIAIELHPKGHSLEDIKHTISKVRAEREARLELVGVPSSMLENLEPYLKGGRKAISFTELYWYYSGTESSPENRIYDLTDVQQELASRKT